MIPRRLVARSTVLVANRKTAAAWVRRFTQTAASAEKDTEEAQDVPWYLRSEESSTAVESSKPMPELPENPPAPLKQVIELMHNKLGIEGIKIFDKRGEDLEEVGQDSLKQFIVIGTGKSDKHLQKATVELMNYVKHDLGNEKLPRVEGFIKTASILRKEKKLRRKLRKNTGYHFEDYGVPLNSWIMVECDRNVGDMTIHFVTEKRREELNLEALWCKPEDRHLYKKIRKPLVNDDIFSGLRRYHTTRETNSGYFKTFADFMIGTKRYHSTGPSDGASEMLAKFKELPIEEARALVSSKTFIEEFQASIAGNPPSQELYDLQLQFQTALHKVAPTEHPFDEIDKIFTQKLASPDVQVTSSDVVDYLIAVLESPDESLKFRLAKTTKIFDLLEFEENALQNWEVGIAPYLLILFSQFTAAEFVKPRDILGSIETLEVLPHQSLKYYAQVEAIFSLLRTQNFNYFKDEDSQALLFMFLTIFGNAKRLDRFYRVLEQAQQDASLPEADPKTWEFVISYVYKTGSRSDYSHFVNTVYPQQVSGSTTELFQTYLQQMRSELASDGGQ